MNTPYRSRTRAVFAASALVLPMLAFCGNAPASPELARAKNCVACHAVDNKLVGPAYKEVAAKYANDKDAETKLAKTIREGGSGGWGVAPMPANPKVSADEARALAKWVLSQK